ncbi:hypothetical protein GCM10027199_35390 [Amycolatopsis magusensis]
MPVAPKVNTAATASANATSVLIKVRLSPLGTEPILVTTGDPAPSVHPHCDRPGKRAT